jgi:hypothetical protein
MQRAFGRAGVGLRADFRPLEIGAQEGIGHPVAAVLAPVQERVARAHPEILPCDHSSSPSSGTSVQTLP